MRIGKITIGSLGDWTPTPGPVTSWHPTAAAAEKVRQAPASPVPVSYMQGQHLRNYHERTAAGLDFSRQIIATCDVPGRCDISAMNYAVNAYLRRHDTFRSWFHHSGDGEFVRHTVGNPADIEFAPIHHGEMTAEEIRAHVVAIPNPLEWGCFTFGVVQNEEYFTFFAAMDHVHGDATLIGTTMLEANGMYAAASAGSEPLELPDAGSFDDFCAREREYTSALTVDSPEVRAWIDFAENNNGSFPEFPLPLGNPSEATASAMVSELVMDAEQTERFESACTAVGVRFIGGLFACIALVEHELTGALTYYGLTPRDTRRTTDNFMTQGWFTGLVPITVPIAAASFADAAWTAQTSFDSGQQLAKVPYYRVLELAPWLKWPQPNFPVSNFFHAGATPLNAVLAAADLGYANNIGIYSDGRYSYQLTIYVFRYGEGTAMAMMYPDNPVAHKSVARYTETMRSVCGRVADTGHWGRVA
ncbi:condensation domain-containing protein [Mycobacterium avium]|uniref:Acyltransferase n=2 Tax=Mycobacterium avium TaxID=1764 RepID=A0A2U2E8B7_MYCAV|nr:condensation domain-containing protein [Mycobacterium avium]APT11375.1 acyltransferase [Mycobacterium avium subsp. hominissuis]AXO24018.1 acyltransferase [Mycobacterium avium subsp. hominissuis]ETZ43249.1 trehalose-2-sulfate acyltransferase papA2 [Mycobacterium avium MAV_120809_2495]KDP10254.1 acyltransferase [Mycobacterium avium subsp. hominissuis 100]MBZ4550877.1 acyltransferase [Mycobacterium avium subsp. hominissuis]